MPDKLSILSEKAAHSVELESFLLGATGPSAKKILITSCHSGEGKTTIACLMALNLALKAKARVLLIDGNYIHPELHSYFNVAQKPGLWDGLESVDEKTLVKKTSYGLLNILPCGSFSTTSVQWLRSGGLKQKLEQIISQYDYVIMESSSVLESSESAFLFKLFDGVLFILECEKTRWEVLQAAQDKVIQVGGKVLGAVLNKRRYYIPESVYAKI